MLQHATGSPELHTVVRVFLDLQEIGARQVNLHIFNFQGYLFSLSSTILDRLTKKMPLIKRGEIPYPIPSASQFSRQAAISNNFCFKFL